MYTCTDIVVEHNGRTVCIPAVLDMSTGEQYITHEDINNLLAQLSQKNVYISLELWRVLNTLLTDIECCSASNENPKAVSEDVLQSLIAVLRDVLDQVEQNTDYNELICREGECCHGV